jgi:hypothetical protein
MIHIIGTRHALQVWTDAKRKGESIEAKKKDVEAFEKCLTDAARSLRADLIAEEANEEFVGRHGQGAFSVAEAVARKFGIRHLFCDPDTGERRAMGLKTGGELTAHATAIANATGHDFMDVHDAELKKNFPAREAFWLERLGRFEPNKKSIIFVCGADHVDSFKALLESKEIAARVHYRDWTEGA